ncbi:unnamed protein product [Oppiella nova]|uniref:Uncharacterized protein n=1 Tax=Oppiella nova TaxID=334625 RepID=A0A7R9LPS6_9ACAR|nr:unnamed protein product [Oppiella nova]CAG2165773.1 unnamed protein product [Oppiella nova]
MSLTLLSSLVSLLWLQLVLLVFRQVIDFCGVQWLMIFFFLIFYNLFVICVYLRVIPKDYQHFLSLDANSKSFFHHLLQNHFSFGEKQLENCVQSIECFQAFIHLLLIAFIETLFVIHLRRIRRKLKQQNDKTTPPLPPYTISPINNAFLTTAGSPPASARSSMRRQTSKRRSKRRQSSQRRRKLITSAAYYSDSETDFYGVTNRSFVSQSPSAAVGNPLYASPRLPYGYHTNETRI